MFGPKPRGGEAGLVLVADWANRANREPDVFSYICPIQWRVRLVWQTCCAHFRSRPLIQEHLLFPLTYRNSCGCIAGWIVRRRPPASRHSTYFSPLAQVPLTALE